MKLQFIRNVDNPKTPCVCAHVRRGKTLCAECNMPIVFDREARIITHEVNTPDCLEAVVFPTSLGATLVPGPNHTDVTTETWRLPMDICQSQNSLNSSPVIVTKEKSCQINRQ